MHTALFRELGAGRNRPARPTARFAEVPFSFFSFSFSAPSLPPASFAPEVLVLPLSQYEWWHQYSIFSHMHEALPQAEAVWLAVPCAGRRFFHRRRQASSSWW
jgi:hypothetical protein